MECMSLPDERFALAVVSAASMFVARAGRAGMRRTGLCAGSWGW